MDRGAQFQVAVGTGAMVQLVGSSLQRCRLHFSVDTGVAYVTDRADGTPGTGFPVTPTSPLIMDKANYGDMLHHAWYGSTASGTSHVGVIDVQEPGVGSV